MREIGVHGGGCWKGIVVWSEVLRRRDAGRGAAPEYGWRTDAGAADCEVGSEFEAQRM